MAIEIKYRGTSWLSDDNSDNNYPLPIGNFGDWKRLYFGISIKADYKTRRDGSLNVVQEDGRVKFILDDGSQWKDFGIFTLDTDNKGVGVKIVRNHLANEDTYVVVPDSGGDSHAVVNGNELSFDAGDVTVANLLSTRYPYSNTNSSGEEYVYNIEFRAFDGVNAFDNDIPMDEIVLNVSLVDNDLLESNNLNSFIDGTLTGFRAKNLVDVSSSLVPLIRIGNQSGMAIRDFRLNRVTGVGDSGADWHFNVEYMIHGLFQSMNKLKAGLPPQFLQNQDSITENFEIKAWPKTGDVNISVPLINKEVVKGNIGWLGENFNGQEAHTVIDNLIIRDVYGNPYERVPYNVETVMTFDLLNTTGNIDLERVGFGIMHIPVSSDEYSENNFTFQENFYVSCLAKDDETGLIPYPSVENDLRQGWGMQGRRIDLTPKIYLENGIAKVEVVITPNAAFSAYMESKDEDDRMCFVWVASQKEGNILSGSDRSTTQLVLNQFEKAAPIVGEYDNLTARLLNHAETSTLSGDKVVHTKPYDDLSGKINLWLPNASVFKMTGITYSIEMVKENDANRFILDSKFLDTSQSVILEDGTQQINVTQSRGFKLANGNEKNKVSIMRDAELDSGDLNGYKGVFGWKNRWEYWLAVSTDEVHSDFFDETQMHNGYNQQWERYVKHPEWDIYFVVYIHGLESDGNEIIYRNPHKFFIGDFDDNPNITTQFYFKNADTGEALVGGSDGTLANKNLGIILSVEQVHFEIQYTLLQGVWTQSILDLLYATATIEIDEGPGFLNLRQISTVVTQENGNPLVPLTTPAQFLKWEIDGTNPSVLKVTFNVNPAELDIGSQYRFTGRLGCKDAVITGQYNNQYNEQYD